VLSATFSFTHTNCPAPNNVEQAKIKKAIKPLSLREHALLSFHHRPHIDDLVVAARITGH